MKVSFHLIHEFVKVVISLIFNRFLVAPIIQEAPKIIKIEKKRTIVVECHVKAQSEPTCLWYKEQTIVQKSSKHTVNIKKVSEVFNKRYMQVSFYMFV